MRAMTKFALTTSLIAALAAAPAFAQSTSADVAGVDQPAPAAAESDQPGDIVVTALRRQQLAKDVPVAVTAISGEKLDVINSSGLDIRFLAARVPSLQAESSFGRTFPRFYIRGLGNTDFDPNAQQPVSVVLDDVALESPMLKAFPVFDLQTVQVLRGPQGTLFGRNTPAGVIKLDSAKPTDTEVSGHVNASWGTFNTVNTDAAVNLPLGGGFAFRASGLLQRRDDYVRNTSTVGVANRDLEGYRDLAGRFQLGYSSPDWNALLGVHVRDLDGTPRVFRAGLFRPGSNEFNTGFDPREVALDGYTSQSMTQYGVNLRIDHHEDGLGTFYSVFGFEHANVESTGDIDGANCYSFIPGCDIGDLGVGLFPSNTGGKTAPTELSQEFRFASDRFGGFIFQAGVYYFNQQLKYDEYNFAGATGDRIADNNQDITHNNRNENYGIFASLDYTIGDLTLRGGLRYSHDSKYDRVSGYSPNLFGYQLPVQARVKGSAVTWDASATYAVTPEINLYARGATGYQGPAIQDRVTFGSRQTTAPKQTTISGEGGVKGTTFDRKLNFALDGYWYRTDDLQITAVGGSANSARLLSADHAIGYGVEAEIEARPVPELAITASGSYNFTKIHDSTLRVGQCATCTILDPIDANGLVQIDGNRLPQAPRWVANWTVRYGVPVGDGEIYAFTDWAYRSEINYFLYDAAEFRGRSQLEGGLKLAYRMPSGIEVGAFARNITNQYRAISAIDFNNLTGMISEPRIIGGQVQVVF
jgi:iron complex outermembrane recepter protein